MARIPLRHPALRVGIIRVLGAGLTLVATVVGLRVLGTVQFGVSVVLIATGQLLALPSTSAERLVLRLAATERHAEAASIVRKANRYSAALLLLALVLAWPLHALLAVDYNKTAAVALTAVMAGEVALRQASCRARGHLMWGQVPNEIVRPALTIAGYLAARGATAEHDWAAVATIIPALATSATMLFAPRAPTPPRAAAVEPRTGQYAPLVSFAVLSVVAAAVERLYPMLTGALASASAVSVVAVGFRLIQVGLFGQALAIYAYSPGIAAALDDSHDISTTGRRALRHVRMLSAIVAIPVVGACLLAPQLVSALFSTSLGLESTLPWVAVAIVAQVATGPSQAALTLSRHERWVAAIYVVGCSVGFVTYFVLRDWGAQGVMGAVAVTYSLWAVGQLAAVKRAFGRFA